MQASVVEECRARSPRSSPLEAAEEQQVQALAGSPG